MGVGGTGVPDPVFDQHKREVQKMTKNFLRLKPHKVKPEHVEFKMLPDLQRVIAIAKQKHTSWQNILKEIKAKELEWSEYRKQAWKKRDICLAKTPPDIPNATKFNAEMIKWEKLFWDHTEPGVIDPTTKAAPVGIPEIERVLNEMIQLAAEKVQRYEDKYAHAVKIIGNPKNGKFVPSAPGMKFDKNTGKFVKDKKQFRFDSDGNMSIGNDADGNPINYLQKDPNNPGARPQLHNDVAGGPVRRFIRRWTGF
jgi:hypothetical protein